MSDLPRVLLIGAGFAGERFAKVLRHLGEDLGHVLLVGACDPRTRLRDRGDDVPHYTELDRAVEELSPDAFVVAVNERDHYPVLRNLAERVGDRRHLVMCEKPMVSNVSEMETLLTLPGWAQLDLRLHMVERHSKVVEDFRWWLAEAGAVRFLRAEFFWGKNRVSDQRPTMGVLSEIIHPLDLIQFITGEQVAGCRSMVVRSDYPIHRSMTQETLDLAGGLGTSGLVVGHTSFAWTARDRRITFHFETADAVYAATLSFDMPRWDCDALRVDRLGGGGLATTVFSSSVSQSDFHSDLAGVGKVSHFVRGSVGLDAYHRAAGADRRVAQDLQRLLMHVDGSSVVKSDLRWGALL